MLEILGYPTHLKDLSLRWGDFAHGSGGVREILGCPTHLIDLALRWEVGDGAREWW